MENIAKEHLFLVILILWRIKRTKKVLFIVVALLAISTVSYGELVAGDFEGVTILDEKEMVTAYWTQHMTAAVSGKRSRTFGLRKGQSLQIAQSE